MRWQQMTTDGGEVTHGTPEERPVPAVQLGIDGIGSCGDVQGSIFDELDADAVDHAAAHREASVRAAAARSAALTWSEKVNAVHPQLLVDRARAGLDVVTGEPVEVWHVDTTVRGGATVTHRCACRSEAEVVRNTYGTRMQAVMYRPE